MPIPDLNSDGLLPDGLHECTIDEIDELFGQFRSSDRRIDLSRQLQAYLTEVKSAAIGKYLAVDGSFVTSKDEPNDIDILLVLKEDVDLTDPNVPPYRSNPVTRSYVRRRYDFDFFWGYEGDESSTSILELFRKVKYRPGESKGFLKVRL